MALYQVNADGNAPSYAKTGDYIATGGGTYQIMDSKIYSGMSKAQRAQAGVGYNPKNNLYSKKVTDQSNPYYTGVSSDVANYSVLSQKLAGVEAWKPKTYDTAENWKEKYIQQQMSQLEENYNHSLSDLSKSYNKNYAVGEKQLNQADADYQQNVDQLYDDAYYNSKLAGQRASQSGMTSAAQGRAMGSAVMFQAADRASQLTNDRDKLKNDINIELNRLSADYNIDKDTLKRNFGANKMEVMSTGELQFLQACLEIDDYNAELWNNLTLNKYTVDREEASAQKEMDWKSAETQKDRDLQMQMLAQQLSASGRSGESGSSNKSSSANYKIEFEKAQSYLAQYQDKLTPDQLAVAERIAIGTQNGSTTAKDVNDYIYSATYKSSSNNDPLLTFLSKFGKRNDMPDLSKYHDTSDKSSALSKLNSSILNSFQKSQSDMDAFYSQFPSVFPRR